MTTSSVTQPTVEVRNSTRFVHLVYECRSRDGRDHRVGLLKATFTLVTGDRLMPASTQQPLVLADQYHGDVQGTSLRRENDLAPYKPRTDIVVTADACSPDQRPLPSWTVRVRVGPVEKTLRVTGERWWVRRLLGWRLTDPQPCTTVPVHYELAYGGEWKHKEKHEAFDENPVGIGFARRWGLHSHDRIPVPRILSPDQEPAAPATPCRPEGLGPIARMWQPRLKRAGSFDDAWLTHRWPDLPDDFDYSFYNCAHPDLIAPGWLSGDEAIDLEGLHPAGSLRTRLPGLLAYAMLRWKTGTVNAVPLHLDTVSIDVRQGIVDLLWRSPLPASPLLRVVDFRSEFRGGN